MGSQESLTCRRPPLFTSAAIENSLISQPHKSEKTVLFNFGHESYQSKIWFFLQQECTIMAKPEKQEKSADG